VRCREGADTLGLPCAVLSFCHDVGPIHGVMLLVAAPQDKYLYVYTSCAGIHYGWKRIGEVPGGITTHKWPTKVGSWRPMEG